MFQDGTLLSVAELLMDLEENPSLRKVVAAEIRSQLRPSEGNDILDALRERLDTRNTPWIPLTAVGPAGQPD
jgi:hypothetical protein